MEIFADKRLVVLDKPAGLLSVPGIGPEKQDCLARRVQRQRPDARIVHRLDRETSGVIVMALDRDAHRELSRQFEQRLVGKRYIAVVSGRPEPDDGEIELPLRKDLDDKGPRHMVDHQRGRWALTRYRLLRADPDRSRLELSPVTGRSHQIRVHCKAVGHPILGDDLYAPPAVTAMSDRLLLHSQSLTITHPTSGEPMTFESPTPF